MRKGLEVGNWCVVHLGSHGASVGWSLKGTGSCGSKEREAGLRGFPKKDKVQTLRTGKLRMRPAWLDLHFLKLVPQENTDYQGVGTGPQLVAMRPEGQGGAGGGWGRWLHYQTREYQRPESN